MPEIGSAPASSKLSLAGFGTSLLRLSDRELGERALGSAHHLVAGLDAGDVRPDSLDRARDIPAEDGKLRRAEPDRDTRHVRHPGHQVPHVRATAGRMHAQQHIVLADHRFLDVSELEHVGRAVSILHDRLHPDPSLAAMLALSMCTPYTSMSGEYVYGVHLSIR